MKGWIWIPPSERNGGTEGGRWPWLCAGCRAIVSMRGPEVGSVCWCCWVDERLKGNKEAK